MTFTTGFERRGLLRDRRRRRVGAAIGVEHITKTVSAAEEFATPSRWSSGTSTTRWPTRRSCRCTSSPARPASTSRWCCPARAPTSCSAATTSTASRCRCAAFDRAAGRGASVRSAGLSRRLPRRHARQGPAPPRLDPAGAALLRQRPDLPRRRAGLPRAARPATCRTWRSPRELYAAHPRGRLRRRHRDAVRRPVHLAARRHPGQGRQDDDGQLAGAAGAVPRPRGLQGRRARCRWTSG